VLRKGVGNNVVVSRGGELFCKEGKEILRRWYFGGAFCRFVMKRRKRVKVLGLREVEGGGG